MQIRLTEKRTTILAHIIMLVYAVWSIFPIAWFFVMSFKPHGMTLEYPPKLYPLTLENFQFLFGMGFLRNIMDSLIVSLGCVGLLLAISAPAAYVLTRFGLRGGESTAFVILSTRMIPPIVVTIPIFFTASALGLLDTHLILILMYTGFTLAFSVWMLRGVFVAVPPVLDEAAMVDGCSRMGALLKIVFPLAWPGIAATAIFCFSMCWNEFVLASVLCGSNVVTAPVYISQSVTSYGVDWSWMMAAGSITLLPQLVFAVAIQKYIVRGLTFGYAR